MLDFKGVLNRCSVCYICNSTISDKTKSKHVWIIFRAHPKTDISFNGGLQEKMLFGPLGIFWLQYQKWPLWRTRTGDWHLCVIQWAFSSFRYAEPSYAGLISVSITSSAVMNHTLERGQSKPGLHPIWCAVSISCACVRDFASSNWILKCCFSSASLFLVSDICFILLRHHTHF